MVNIFVYGTLKKGFGLNYLMDSSKFVGESSLEDYEMYSLMSFAPFITKGNGKVFGEVYEISENLLRKIDLFEAKYNREEVDIEVSGKKMKAYVYVIKIDIKKKGLPFLLNRINSGVWTWKGI